MKKIRPVRNTREVLAALLAVCLGSLALAGNASALSFSPVTSLPAGSWPLSVVSADFNSDGKPDLASGNASSSTYSLMLGDGAGGFAPALSFPAGGQPQAIASADFNGDGNPDLAGGNAFGNTVSILLGDGAGGFSAATNFPVSGGPLSMVSADFNGDGKADLATANPYPGNISILLGNGTGGFGPATNFVAGSQPWSIDSADLNGDGFADLAVANSSPGIVSVLLGNGSGSFGPASNFPTAGSGSYAVEITDLNGDGKLDLVAASSSPGIVSVLLGDGTGSFGPASTFAAGPYAFRIAVGDFDGDGNPDVAATNIEHDTVSVLLGDGTGSLGPASTFAVGDNPFSMIAADLNGDGLDDLVTSNRHSADLSLLLNTTIVPSPDVVITKTAAPTDPRPGDTVTYTLEARNIGDVVAQDVVITDALPAGVSLVSASGPCTFDFSVVGTVTCERNTLLPGAGFTLTIEVTVDPWGTADTSYNHLLDVQRVEAQIDLNAGEQRTFSVACPSGFFATDGSVRIDQIDQGTGDWPSPQVLESRAGSLGSWQGTVKNTATGRAQAKIFAVCIRETTSPNGHTHNLTVSAPVTTTNAAPIGIHEATLQCGPGQVAIQPGFISTSPADLVYSQPAGNGWRFSLDMKAAGNVTFSIRCLTRQVAMTGGHTHDLGLERIWHEVTVEAGKVNEAQLTCADGSKGIVAGFDLDHGLLSLGNDPRPVTRAFKLYNPTDHPLTARLSLLCLGDRTGGEHTGPIFIHNTAWISTSSNEIETGNNMDSATITAEDTDNFTPVIPEPPVKPTPNNPIAMKIAGGDAFYSGGAVTAWINCSGACQGTAKLLTGRAIRAHGKLLKKGTMLAKGRFNFSGAGTSKIKLKVTARGRKLFRIRKMSRGLLTLTGGPGKSITIK